MLKYQVKKGVSIEIGMAFRYKSIEELKALLYALGESENIATKQESSNSSLKDSGLLVFVMEDEDFSSRNSVNKVRKCITRKYLVGSDERVVRKKDFFDKTEYDNGTRNNKGKTLNDQWDVNENKPFVAVRIQDDSGLFEGTSFSKICSDKESGKYANQSNIVPTHHENISTTFEKQNDVNTDGGYNQKEHQCNIDNDVFKKARPESDRLKKLAEEKFPFFKHVATYNILSDSPSLEFEIRNTGYKFKIWLKDDIVTAFAFGNTSSLNLDIHVESALISLIKFYFIVNENKTQNVRKINIEGLGDILVVNKKTLDGSGGPQGFFDMLYKLKTIVVDGEEKNNEYKKDFSNIASISYLDYIYRNLEVIRYLDGTAHLVIPASDKRIEIDLKLLKDYILEQDIKKVNDEHLLKQYKSIGHGYSVEELKDENGVLKKHLIKPDGSKVIIE